MRTNIPQRQQLWTWKKDCWHCCYCHRPLFFGPSLLLLENMNPGRGYYHPNGATGKMLQLFQQCWASVDHIVPVTHGGTNDQENLVSCCMICNIRRGNFVDDRYVTSKHPSSCDLRWDGFALLYPLLLGGEDKWTRIIRDVYA